jgi:uridine kinase
VTLILDTYPLLIRYIAPLTSRIQPGDLIFIGGQSRSGKGSFASALRYTLQEQGLKCDIISTDSWLLNEAERGNDVLNRHDVVNLRCVISTMLNKDKRPRQLFLPGYLKVGREHVPNVRSFESNPEQVIIFEGVVALYFADLFNVQHTFFVNVDEETRKQRVIKEYILRGYSKEKAEDVYFKRLTEEVPWVVSTNKHAVMVSIPIKQ